MADGVRFELTEPVKVHTLSKRAQSTTLPPFQTIWALLRSTGFWATFAPAQYFANLP